MKCHHKEQLIYATNQNKSGLQLNFIYLSIHTSHRYNAYSESGMRAFHYNDHLVYSKNHDSELKNNYDYFPDSTVVSYLQWSGEYVSMQVSKLKLIPFYALKIENI